MIILLIDEQLIKRIMLEAGQSIIQIYDTNFHVEYKKDNSPLTLADKKANDIIVSALTKEYPNYAMLSEELKDDKSRLNNEYCFIVDPLDGTKEFINKTGEFTVNIALSYKGKSVFGMIYAPVINKLYYGSYNEGSYCENLKTGEIYRLKVSNKIDNIIWVGSRSHSSEKEKNLISKKNDIISDIISAGSSLKGCMVAEAKADVYYRFGLTSEWDTAAMQCIVEEAGGIFRQMDGSNMFYNREKNLNDKGFYIVNRKENIWV